MPYDEAGRKVAEEAIAGLHPRDASDKLPHTWEDVAKEMYEDEMYEDDEETERQVWLGPDELPLKEWDGEEMSVFPDRRSEEAEEPKTEEANESVPDDADAPTTILLSFAEQASGWALRPFRCKNGDDATVLYAQNVKDLTQGDILCYLPADRDELHCLCMQLQRYSG